MGPLRHPPPRGLWEKNCKRPLSLPRQTLAPPRAGDGSQAQLSPSLWPSKDRPRKLPFSFNMEPELPRPSPKVSSFLPKEALDTALLQRAKGWLVTGQQLPWRLSCPTLLQVRLSLGAPLRGIVSSTAGPSFSKAGGPCSLSPHPHCLKGYCGEIIARKTW